MSEFQICSSYSASMNGVPGPVSIEWPGGDGWFVVGPDNLASFSGDAKMIASIDISGQFGIGTEVPTNPATMNAKGTYQFSAPAGLLNVGLSVSSGSVSNLSMYAVTIDK